MHARAPRTGARTIVMGLALAAGLTAAGSSAAAADDPGGAPPTPAPRVASATCLKRCPGVGEAAIGSVVRVRGRNLSAARGVLFYGRKGAGDNRLAAPTRATATTVDVTVPSGARTGTVAVVTADGQTSAATVSPLAVAKSLGADAPAPQAAASSALDVEITRSKVYYAARRKAGLSFVLTTPQPEDVRVDLVALSTRQSVAHWIAYAVEPGSTQTVSWNGRAGRRVAPAGRYEFRVAVGQQPRVAGVSRKAPPAQSSSATPPPPAGASRAGRITFLDDMFPIRGRHDYGSSGNRFGAGRAGHMHQGQDVMAACGTRLVAERGGKVKYKGYQGAAGNYLVIDGAGTDLDTVYMHLRAPALVRKGQHVYTGQPIGYVGDTGDATACHLHFEIWSAPGWYTGGAPIDPLPYLKAWDTTS